MWIDCEEVECGVVGDERHTDGRIAYLTRLWHVVYLDFGPELDDQLSPNLPVVIQVRLAPNYTNESTTPAWLVTPALLAHLCWRIDSSNATAAPSSPEVRGRLERWFSLLDALGAIYERLRPVAECILAEYVKAGEPQPLPVPPTLTTLRMLNGEPVITPWDSPEAEAWYAELGNTRVITSEDVSKQHTSKLG